MFHSYIQLTDIDTRLVSNRNLLVYFLLRICSYFLCYHSPVQPCSSLRNYSKSSWPSRWFCRWLSVGYSEPTSIWMSVCQPKENSIRFHAMSVSILAILPSWNFCRQHQTWDSSSKFNLLLLMDRCRRPPWRGWHSLQPLRYSFDKKLTTINAFV